MNRNNLFPLPQAAEVRPTEDLDADETAIRSAHEQVKKSGRASVEAADRAGGKLAAVWDKWKENKSLVKRLKKIGLPRRTAHDYLTIHQNSSKCATVAHLGVRGVLNFLRTGETGEEDEEEEKEEKQADYVTLEQWNEAGDKARKKLLRTVGTAKFNSQGDNENIEWALWSWNPVTGCLHNCPYCYARDIAERFYDQKFAPSLWPGRLTAPRNTPFPEEKAAEWMGHKNVFVCSMADLFGRWVPTEWIEAVLAEVRAASEWNFLFLTKFPIRMAEFDFPENTWVGTTVDCQARVANAEKAFRKVKAGVKWLSVEPLIEPLKFSDLGAFQWLVLGGSSRSSQTPEWKPPLRWVIEIEEAAADAGVPFYEKSNLGARSERIRQYPGDVPHRDLMKAPKELHYLLADKG